MVLHKKTLDGNVRYMESLREYLKSMDAKARAEFCVRCGTTEGYLRKALSTGGNLGESLCINIERESNGVVLVESLRNDVDWQYLRNRKLRQCRGRAA